MKVKTVVNSKGEPQTSEIKIPLEGGGGIKGKKAVINLISLINSLRTLKTEQDIVNHYYIICGYAICCRDCGFLTKKSLDDLIEMVDHLVVDNELIRTGSSSEKKE